MSNKLKDIELRSEEVRDVLSHVPPWMIRWGNLLFLSLILLILALSWFIKYPDVVTSEAILTTTIPPQKEYAKISGKIDTIWVSDKEQVSKNNVLAILENTANANDIYLLKSILDTLKINKKNVVFPFENIPVLFLGDIESDFSQFENNYFQYILNRDMQPFSEQAIANKVSLSELKKRLQSLTIQSNISNNELQFKKKELNRNETLFEKGIISTQSYENKQLEYLASQRNYESLNITISQLRESLGNAENTSKDTDYIKTREEIRLLKNVVQSYNQLKKSLKEWELKYVLKSNIDGKVSFLNYWNNNQTVNIGDLVFTILPNTTDYVIKLKAPSVNSGKIKIGQKVNISLYDYPEYEFGVIQGKVEAVSETSDAQGNYVVDASISKYLITSFNKKITFKQEMKGKGNIITEDLRLLERLFYQLRDLFKR